MCLKVIMNAYTFVLKFVGWNANPLRLYLDGSQVRDKKYSDQMVSRKSARK